MPLVNVEVVRHVFSAFITLSAVTIIFFGIGAGYAALPGDTITYANCARGVSRKR